MKRCWTWWVCILLKNHQVILHANALSHETRLTPISTRMATRTATTATRIGRSTTLSKLQETHHAA